MREVVDINSKGFGGRKLRRRRMLRVLVPIGFVVVIFAALLSITAFSYYSNLKDSLALSSDLLEAIEKRIAEELETFLTPIEDTLQLAEAVLENASFDIGNRLLLEPLAFTVLTNLRQISAFNVADDQGNFLMVKKMGDGSYHTKIVDRTRKPTQVTWIRRDRSGKTLDEQKTIDDSFDPRNRPWYVGAVESGQVHWTDFYVFFTDRKYGITVSLPLILPQERLRGVLALDIELETISKFLETLKIGRNGRAIIVSDEGEIVAHPELDKMLVREGELYRAVRVEELKDPVLQRAYNRFQIEGHGYRNLTVDDRRYLASAFSFPTKIGHELTVYILVPEEDFVGFINRNNRKVLLMSAGVLILASLMAGLMVYQGLRADRSARLVLARQNELEAQSNAFAELSSQAALFDPADPDSLSRLTEIVSKSIGVRRASVWELDNEAGVLRCIDSYDRESDGHTQGIVLAKTDLPQLFDLLHKNEDIRVPHAGADDRLHDLYYAYLQPLGCDSLLGVPIRDRDVVSGWLWFEHDRLSRDWSSEEVSFAGAITNMLALRFAAAPNSSSGPEKEADTSAARDAPCATHSCDGSPQTAGSFHPEKRRIGAARTAATTTGRSLPSMKRLPPRGIDPETVAADLHEDTTVLMLRFTDPEFLARRLSDNASGSSFDHLVNHLEELVAAMGIGYMRVMGDEIVCAAGMGDKNRDHCRLVAELALRIQDRCIDMSESLNLPLEFRIGIDTGAVLGSSVGKGRESYNIWGEAVRFASMLAKTGVPGAIQVSESTYRCIRSGFLFKARGKFYLPDIGEISTYLLTG